MTTELSPDSTSPAAQQTSRPHRLGGTTLAIGGTALLVGLIIGPGPDIADVHAGNWVPAHALQAAGFLLLAIALPSLTRPLGSRLGVLGAVGYAALMSRLVLSTGSHLYSMLIMPTLAEHPELNDLLQHTNALGSIYAGHGQVFNDVIAVGLLGLAITLWRDPSRLRVFRVTAGGMLLAAVFEVAGLPFGLLGLAALGIWLGLRLAIRDDVTVPLRHSP